MVSPITRGPLWLEARAAGRAWAASGGLSRGIGSLAGGAITPAGPGSPSTKSLVLVPALITLAVTLLRLTGELMGWSPVFFARAAGGAAALVGIVWLVPVFGFLFARRLASSEPAPAAGGVIGHALLAIGVLVVAVFVAAGVLKDIQGAQIGVFSAAGVVAAWIAYRAWPRLGQV